MVVDFANIDSTTTNNNEEEGGPAAKKLRSCDNDLKIIVGTASADEANSNTSNNCPREFWYVSNVMAYHSNFFDTMLSSQMQESISREIKLPDVDPDHWELLMKYLSPKQGRKLTLEDAVTIAPLYDKYEFRQGRELCDEFLADHFLQEREKVAEQGGRSPKELCLLIEACETIEAFNFSKQASKECYKFFDQIISDKSSLYGRLMFQEKHLEKLIPSIQKLEKRLGYIPPLFGPRADAEYENPLFASLLRTEWEREKILSEFLLLGETGISGLKSVEVYDGGTRHLRCHFTTKYTRDVDFEDGLRFCSRNRGEPPVFIEKLDLPDCDIFGWTIYMRRRPTDDGTKKLLWCVPSSFSHPLPPKEGWISCPDNNRLPESFRLCIRYGGNP